MDNFYKNCLTTFCATWQLFATFTIFDQWTYNFSKWIKMISNGLKGPYLTQNHLYNLKTKKWPYAQNGILWCSCITSTTRCTTVQTSIKAKNWKIWSNMLVKKPCWHFLLNVWKQKKIVWGRGIHPTPPWAPS